MAQFGRPNSDIAIGGWTTNTGGTTNLWATLDEVTASDTDYVISVSDPVNTDILDMNFKDTDYTARATTIITPPASSTGVYLRWRDKRTTGAGHTITVYVDLYEGVTKRAGSSHVTTVGFIQSDYNLTAAEVNSITDWNNLHVKVYAQWSGTGSAKQAYVSWVALELPSQNLTGTVTHYDASAVSGATVNFTGGSTTTDSSGNYTGYCNTGADTDIYINYNDWMFRCNPEQSPPADFWDLNNVTTAQASKNFTVNDVKDVNWCGSSNAFREHTVRYPITYPASHSQYTAGMVVKAREAYGLHKRMADDAIYNSGVQEFSQAYIMSQGRSYLFELCAGAIKSRWKAEVPEAQWSNPATICTLTGSGVAIGSDSHFYMNFSIDALGYLWGAGAAHNSQFRFKRSKYPKNSEQWYSDDNDPRFDETPANMTGTYPWCFTLTGTDKNSVAFPAIGRYYVFFKYSGDTGQLCYMYSDDAGVSWSGLKFIADRYRSNGTYGWLYAGEVKVYGTKVYLHISTGSSGDQYTAEQCIFACADLTADSAGTDDWRFANGTLYQNLGNPGTTAATAPIRPYGVDKSSTGNYAISSGWSNPTNAYTSDDSYATANTLGQAHIWDTLAYALPTGADSEVLGVKVALECKEDITGSATWKVKLAKNRASSVKNPTAEGTQQWTNPSNARTNNDTCATAGASTIAGFWNTFAYAVPTTATILGIKVDIKCSANVATGDYLVNLGKDESTLATEKTYDNATAGTCGASQNTVTGGGEFDLWGTTWTPAQINSNNFCVKITSTGSATTWYLDGITVTIYYVEYSSEKTFAQSTTVDTTTTLGDVSDLWGFTSLSAAEVNGATFGVRIEQGTAGFTYSLDAITVTVYYTHSDIHDITWSKAYGGAYGWALGVQKDSSGNLYCFMNTYSDTSTVFYGPMTGRLIKHTGTGKWITGTYKTVYTDGSTRVVGAGHIDWNDHIHMVWANRTGDVKLRSSFNAGSSFATAITLSSGNMITPWRCCFRRNNDIQRLDILLAYGFDIYLLSPEPGASQKIDTDVRMVYGSTQIDRTIENLSGSDVTDVIFKIQANVPANKTCDLIKGYNLYTANENALTVSKNRDNIYASGFQEDFEDLTAGRATLHGQGGWTTDPASSTYIEVVKYDDLGSSHIYLYEGQKCCAMNFVDTAGALIRAYHNLGTNVTGYWLKGVMKAGGNPKTFFYFKDGASEFRAGVGVNASLQAKIYYGDTSTWTESATEVVAGDQVVIAMWIDASGCRIYYKGVEVTSGYTGLTQFDDVGFGVENNASPSFIDYICCYPGLGPAPSNEPNPFENPLEHNGFFSNLSVGVEYIQPFIDPLVLMRRQKEFR